MQLQQDTMLLSTKVHKTQSDGTWCDMKRLNMTAWVRVSRIVLRCEPLLLFIIPSCCSEIADSWANQNQGYTPRLVVTQCCMHNWCQKHYKTPCDTIWWLERWTFCLYIRVLVSFASTCLRTHHDWVGRIANTPYIYMHTVLHTY